MEKQQARQQIEQSLNTIIPHIRLLNHQTRFGGSVAELKWGNSIRYLPIIDQRISHQSNIMK